MRLKQPSVKTANGSQHNDAEERVPLAPSPAKSSPRTINNSKSSLEFEVTLPNLPPVTSHYWQRILAVVLLGCLAVFLWDAELLPGTSSYTSADNAGGSVKLKNKTKSAVVDSAVDTSDSMERPDDKDDCASTCNKGIHDAKLNADVDLFGGDLLQYKDLVQLVEKQRELLRKRLKKDYGEDTYMNMFEPEQEVYDPETNTTVKRRVNAGKYVFRSPSMLAKEPTEGPAWDRMKRKMKLKVLQMQLGVLEQREESCQSQCGAATGKRRRLSDTNDLPYFARFTHVTGGHSASAGHGNLFDESYTANLERALKPIFGAVGIEFVGKNYAMGGTASAPEVALCGLSIFGHDVDSISWDYGMTDGRAPWKFILYGYRAAIISRLDINASKGSKTNDNNPTRIQQRPVFVGVHCGNDRAALLQTFQEMGMTVLAMDESFSKNVVQAAIPDTAEVGDDKAVQEMAPYVRYLKCGNQIEKGDPGCGENKFNSTICSHRRFRTSWHPGWKYHALVGNVWAMNYLDALAEGLQELLVEFDAGGENEQADAKALHQRLQKKLDELDLAEHTDYEKLLNSKIPEEWVNRHFSGFFSPADEHLEDLSYRVLFKEPSFCHTALLPAEVRFQGFLTENFTHTTTTITNQSYEIGLPSQDVFKVEKPRDPALAAAFNDTRAGHDMILIADGRQECEVHLNLDFKDSFLLSSIEGWRTMTIPNDSELEYYKEWSPKDNKGYILLCLSNCDWGKCAIENLRKRFGYIDEISGGKNPLDPEEVKKYGHVEMEVNGIKVTEHSNINSCFALQHTDDKGKKSHMWKPNSHGKYEIRARITDAEKYSYVRFSSFILF